MGKGTQQCPKARCADGGLMRDVGEWAFWRRCLRVGSPPVSLVSDSFVVRIPGSLGAGRPSPPCPWGEGKGGCWRREKRRRCESNGLRAPFVCTETESGFGGSRRFAYLVPSVPRALAASVYPEGV